MKTLKNSLTSFLQDLINTFFFQQKQEDRFDKTLCLLNNEKQSNQKPNKQAKKKKKTFKHLHPCYSATLHAKLFSIDKNLLDRMVQNNVSISITKKEQNKNKNKNSNSRQVDHFPHDTMCVTQDTQRNKNNENKLMKKKKQ
ncbi:hypothetical protein RFI_37891 [Reticulomyxa filosa]|uniref:Uncharacterized protein n=1 Tax=Reticulomyxa filosa TaxID=46433 RepID=X6LDX9_RETFI|nr:hypothetical protein RFI_37891 [Reticulomyxa filosa]|eukprot:ETN99580.1 hypothetical protein RFI_37891 [Reticulomyxa filosa]